ncbi:MAG: TonB-dependent receptor plug domain-containing protein [Acidobacteriota bacterium]
MTRQARSSSAAPSRSLIGFALLLGALSAAAETEPASSEPADGVLIRVSDEDELIEADSVLFEVDESEGGGIDAACSACVAAELRVNGLTGDRVEVRFDGIPLVGGLPRLLHLTQLPDDVVASTTVQRGPGSVLTGMSGLGGSIDLRSVPRDERRLLVETELGDWGWRRLRAAATDRFGRVGALVLVQGALHDAHSSNGDAYNEVADYERFTYLGRLDFELTDRQTLTLGASFQGNDQLDGLGGVYRHTEAGPPRVSDWRYAPQDRFLNWRSFTARWRHESASGLSFTADGQYSRHGEQQWTFVSQIELDEGRKRLTYDLENELSHGRFTAEVPVGHAGLLTAGLGWSKQRLWVGQTYG